MRSILGASLVLLGLSALVRAKPLATVVTSGSEGCHAVALTFDLCPVRKAPGFDDALVDAPRRTARARDVLRVGPWMASTTTRCDELLARAILRARHARPDAPPPPARSTPAAQRAEITGSRHPAATSDYGRTADAVPRAVRRVRRPTRAVAADVGLRLVQWSVVSGDPDPQLAAASHAAQRCAPSCATAAIIVFHANGKGLHTREVVETLLRDDRCPSAGSDRVR